MRLGGSASPGARNVLGTWEMGRLFPGSKRGKWGTCDLCELQPGGEVRLVFTVPPNARGEWEMGCLFPGHYESGMKGALVIQ